MLHTLKYSVLDNYPEIDCRSLWITGDHMDGSIVNRQGALVLNFDLKKYGLDEAFLVFAQQVHGSNVKPGQGPGILENCDGIISTHPGLAPVIRTADCAAVIMFDPVQKVVANVHVGWRGAEQKIISHGLRMLVEENNSRPSDLIVAISPFIKSCCYKVGQEFKKIFSGEYLQEREGKLYFDLENCILDELLLLNINHTRIEVKDRCTYCNEMQFPSFRRTKTKNRLMSMIKIKE